MRAVCVCVCVWMLYGVWLVHLNNSKSFRPVHESKNLREKNKAIICIMDWSLIIVLAVNNRDTPFIDWSQHNNIHILNRSDQRSHLFVKNQMKTKTKTTLLEQFQNPITHCRNRRIIDTPTTRVYMPTHYPGVVQAIQ